MLGISTYNVFEQFIKVCHNTIIPPFVVKVNRFFRPAQSHSIVEYWILNEMIKSGDLTERGARCSLTNR